MAAAADFENGATLLVVHFASSACFFSLCIKFHRNRAIKVELPRLISFFDPKDAKVVVIKLLLVAKTPFLGRDKR